MLRLRSLNEKDLFASYSNPFEGSAYGTKSSLKDLFVAVYGFTFNVGSYKRSSYYSFFIVFAERFNAALAPPPFINDSLRKLIETLV